MNDRNVEDIHRQCNNHKKWKVCTLHLLDTVFTGIIVTVMTRKISVGYRPQMLMTQKFTISSPLCLIKLVDTFF